MIRRPCRGLRGDHAGSPQRPAAGSPRPILTSAFACAVLLVTASPPAIGAAADDAARQFMLAIDTRYEELRTVPRRAEMRIAVTTRTLGAPDQHVRGTATIHQLDRRARFEMDTAIVEGAGTSQTDCGVTPAGHLVWVMDGTRLSIRYEPPATPETPETSRALEASNPPETDQRPPARQHLQPQEMRADFGLLPPELGLRFRDPMGEPELGREFLNHPFTLRDGVLDGRAVKVLRSMSEVVFSRNSRAEVTFWVDPESLLIVRAVYDGLFKQDDGNERAVATEMDLSYRLGVALPDRVFALEIGPDARDITDMIAREGRAALGMLP
ncbi:MAG: hypothetical protein ABSG76_12595 [Xanthobacteraceae bacterium]